MNRKVLKAERVIHLKHGIDINGIQDTVGRESYFKHKDPCNMKITGSDASQVKVPTKDIMDILSIWGVQDNFSGIFVLTSYTEEYPHTYNVDILNQDFTTTYECNSREILKEVNELERIIVAGRKLAGIDVYEGLYNVPMQLLLTASMCNDPDKTVALLRKYHTAGIVRTVKSPDFRHIYKLIHPKTTFIRTPIEESKILTTN